MHLFLSDEFSFHRFALRPRWSERCPKTIVAVLLPLAQTFTTRKTDQRGNLGRGSLPTYSTATHSRSSQDTEAITSQTESVTAFTCCNKEHSCPATYSFYRCESYGHRITRASSLEPSSHPGHSLEHYTCSKRTTMPQQSYKSAKLTAESSPSGSLVLLQSNPFTFI